MTTKERWTVYPLLLLAIGLAVRGNTVSQVRVPAVATGTISAETVICKELAIVTPEGQIIVHAGRVKDGGGGRIEIRDASGIDALGLGTSAQSRDGAIEFFGPDGKPIGRLGPHGNPPAQETP